MSDIELIIGKLDSIDGKFEELKENVIRDSGEIKHLREDLQSEKQNLKNHTTSFLAFKELYQENLAKAINKMNSVSDKVDILSVDHKLLEETLKKNHEEITTIDFRLKDIEKKSDSIIKQNHYDKKFIKIVAAIGIFLGFILGSFQVLPVLLKMLFG